MDMTSTVCSLLHEVRGLSFDAGGLGWQFGVAVTRWSRSTELLYIEPG